MHVSWLLSPGENMERGVPTPWIRRLGLALHSLNRWCGGSDPGAAESGPLGAAAEVRRAAADPGPNALGCTLKGEQPDTGGSLHERTRLRPCSRVEQGKHRQILDECRCRAEDGKCMETDGSDKPDPGI
jgi:hypothetical protein